MRIFLLVSLTNLLLVLAYTLILLVHIYRKTVDCLLHRHAIEDLEEY